MPPLTTGQAKAAGVSRASLRSHAYRKLFHGVYLSSAERLDLAAWVSAARLLLPAEATASGLTALKLRGLDFGPDFPLTFVVPVNSRHYRDGLRLIRRNPSPAGGVAQLPVAFEDACGLHPLGEAVQIGERLLHLGTWSLEDVDRVRTLGGPHTRKAAALVRPGAESVQETRLRLLLTGAGLPEPRLQVQLGGRSGPIGRVDMLIEAQGLVIEYEGDQHRTDAAQWNRDIERYRRLGEAGFEVIRVTAAMLRDPWAVVTLVHTTLVRRGHRGPRPRATAAWHSIFVA